MKLLLPALLSLAKPLLIDAKTKCPQNSVGGETFVDVTQCDSNNYKNACKISDQNTHTSCVCDGTSNFYYICLGDCNDYPFRTDGECVQCYAGSFFGEVYFKGASCSTDSSSYCTKCIETKTGWYYFEYVCNHNAAYDAKPRNLVSFYPDGSKCQQCPAGTYSIQGLQVCAVCPQGQYSSNAGSSSCQTCSPGK